MKNTISVMAFLVLFAFNLCHRDPYEKYMKANRRIDELKTIYMRFSPPSEMTHNANSERNSMIFNFITQQKKKRAKTIRLSLRLISLYPSPSSTNKPFIRDSDGLSK